MTQDEIIEMAAEIWNAGSSFPIPSSDDVLRFAKLVAAAAEREACALLCYEQRKNWDALACADAIQAGTRPRGQA